jgi:hypothetical protein
MKMFFMRIAIPFSLPYLTTPFPMTDPAPITGLDVCAPPSRVAGHADKELMPHIWPNHFGAAPVGGVPDMSTPPGSN